MEKYIEGIKMIVQIIGGMVVTGGAIWLFAKRPTAKAKQIKELKDLIEKHEHRIDTLEEGRKIDKEDAKEMREDMREMLRFIMEKR